MISILRIAKNKRSENNLNPVAKLDLSEVEMKSNLQVIVDIVGVGCEKNKTEQKCEKSGVLSEDFQTFCRGLIFMAVGISCSGS